MARIRAVYAAIAAIADPPALDRRIIASEVLWAGHMATCTRGAAHDESVLGVDFRRAHNPYSPETASSTATSLRSLNSHGIFATNLGDGLLVAHVTDGSASAQIPIGLSRFSERDNAMACGGTISSCQ